MASSSSCLCGALLLFLVILCRPVPFLIVRRLLLLAHTFLAPKRHCAAPPRLQISSSAFVTKSESHWLTPQIVLQFLLIECLSGCTNVRLQTVTIR